MREYMRKWREENPENVRKNSKTYYEKHKQECDSRAREYMRAHPEKYAQYRETYFAKDPTAQSRKKERCKEWGKENADRIKKLRLEYVAANRIAVTNAQMRWKKNNPDKTLEYKTRHKLTKELGEKAPEGLVVAVVEMKKVQRLIKKKLNV